MMFVITAIGAPVRVGRPSELGAEEGTRRILEQTALFEVGEQSRCGLVHAVSAIDEALVKVVV